MENHCLHWYNVVNENEIKIGQQGQGAVWALVPVPFFPLIKNKHLCLKAECEDLAGTETRQLDTSWLDASSTLPVPHLVSKYCKKGPSLAAPWFPISLRQAPVYTRSSGWSLPALSFLGTYLWIYSKLLSKTHPLCSMNFLLQIQETRTQKPLAQGSFGGWVF